MSAGQLARQALTDSTWTVSDRVAACLVLVYGQSLSRIVVLTTASIGTTPDGAPEDTPAQELTLTLAKDPITIPGPLANLIRQLPEPKAGFAATIDNANPWLFPGARAGQHITRGNLSWRMNRLGIRPGPAATAPCYTWPARCPRP